MYKIPAPKKRLGRRRPRRVSWLSTLFSIEQCFLIQREKKMSRNCSVPIIPMTKTTTSGG